MVSSKGTIVLQLNVPVLGVKDTVPSVTESGINVDKKAVFNFVSD